MTGISATVAAMLTAEGMDEAASLLKTGKFRVEETGYDNWNGGTTIFTVYLTVAPEVYARLRSRRGSLEKQINERLKPVIEQFTSDWVSVTIAPEVAPQPEWRDTDQGVTREIRQNIIDGLMLEDVRWSGRLDEVEFPQRLFDLRAMSSGDSRFKDAAGDIWQHRYNNPGDWEPNWVYSDRRFNLLNGPTETFLRFLCEMIHPLVRPDRNESLKLAQQFNDQLRSAHWRLVEQEKIAGRPRFVPELVHNLNARSVSRARSVADALDAGWMQKEIQRLENAIDRDPALAIGTAKELVETCCKSILAKRSVEVSRGADLPQLTKLLAKELQLVPEGIPDEAKGSETIRKRVAQAH